MYCPETFQTNPTGSYREAVEAQVVLPALFLRDGALDTLEALGSKSTR
ncbi:hypothetical protein Q5689_23405 [Microcoleus sp. ARI1-A2]